MTDNTQYTSPDNTTQGDTENTSAQPIVSQRRNIIVRALYITLGTIALVLGSIGIILPILPTTPFFLLTAFCYARGSKKFHTWFLSSKLDKKHLSGFAEHKSMTLKGKLTLMICVSCMLIISCMLADLLVVSIILPILVLIKYTYFILAVKTVSRQQLDDMKTAKQETINA